mmetsp:Transcript_4391/g.7800  ORF Transcript_4391/g.7800 Transcript_4391/m.7800 type:complete len:132 (-) Transcript_4391:556-951(-)
MRNKDADFCVIISFETLRLLLIRLSIGTWFSSETTFLQDHLERIDCEKYTACDLRVEPGSLSYIAVVLLRQFSSMSIPCLVRSGRSLHDFKTNSVGGWMRQTRLGHFFAASSVSLPPVRTDLTTCNARCRE